eukprot:scaffold215507_cov19-Tisochrysis_lutea.AAC.1
MASMLPLKQVEEMRNESGMGESKAHVANCKHAEPSCIEHRQVPEHVCQVHFAHLVHALLTK